MKLGLDGKRALVLGASKGLGAAIAIALANEGVHVIGAARSVGDIAALDDKVDKAIEKCGFERDLSYISTGGGPFLESVEGKTLPAVAALERRAAAAR